MKKTNQVIYGLFGIGALLFGFVALFFPAVLLPETAQSFHLRHIFREEGAAAIFIGPLRSARCPSAGKST